MNYVQTEPSAPSSNWQTSLFFALLLHTLLLGGLYYLNSENPSAIIPNALIDWLGDDAETTVVDP